MDRKGRNKEEIPGSKRGMYSYLLTHSRLLKGEHLSSVFSPDPHCGAREGVLERCGGVGRKRRSWNEEVLVGRRWCTENGGEFFFLRRSKC